MREGDTYSLEGNQHSAVACPNRLAIAGESPENRGLRAPELATPQSGKVTCMIPPRHLELTHSAIDHAGIVERVRSNLAGAVVLFLGTVRELTDGKRTTALEYEAYPEMALRQLDQLVDQAATKWPLIKAAVIHRLGHLELGDIAVAVAVSTPHRRESFEAGQWIMDRIKEVVPIWKKENWSDGTSEWVHPHLPSRSDEAP